MTTLLPVAAGDRMAVRRLLGYAPRQLSADASLTGRENAALFARVFDVSRRERAARVGQAHGACRQTPACPEASSAATPSTRCP